MASSPFLPAAPPPPPHPTGLRSGLVCSSGAGGCSQAGKRCSIWGSRPRTSVLVSSLNSEASAAELVRTPPGCGARACHVLPSSSCPRDAGPSAPTPWPRVLRRVHSLCARPLGRPARVQPAPPQAAPLWPGQGPRRCVHGTGRDRRGQDHSWAAQASGSCSCGHVPFFVKFKRIAVDIQGGIFLSRGQHCGLALPSDSGAHRGSRRPHLTPPPVGTAGMFSVARVCFSVGHSLLRTCLFVCVKLQNESTQMVFVCPGRTGFA